MLKGVLKIDPLLKQLLHYISVCGTFMVLFGIFFLVQKYTIGILLSLHNKYLFNIPLDILVFTPSTILIIKQYFKISSPYSKD